jgi:hypothetical protein
MTKLIIKRQLAVARTSFKHHVADTTITARPAIFKIERMCCTKLSGLLLVAVQKSSHTIVSAHAPLHRSK